MDQSSKLDEPTKVDPPSDHEQVLSEFRKLRRIVTEYGVPISKLGTFVGLLITGIYFIRAGAMPLDSLSSLGALALVVALISLFTALTFLVVWVMPPAIALLFQKNDPNGRLSDWFQQDTDSEKSFPSHSLLRRLYFSATTVGITWIGVIAASMPDIFGNDWIRCGLVLATLAVALIFSWSYARYPVTPEAGGIRNTLAVALHRLLFVIGYGAMSVFPLWLFLFLLVASDFHFDNSAATMWILLGGGFVVVTIVNSVGLEVFQRLQGMRAFGGLALWSLCSLLVLVLLLGSSTRILDGVMRTSSVRIENTTIALDGKTCVALQSLGVIPTMMGDSCLLVNVTIISRVGERWVVACDRENRKPQEELKQRRRSFQIEAKSVQVHIDTSTKGREETKKEALCS